MTLNVSREGRVAGRVRASRALPTLPALTRRALQAAIEYRTVGVRASVRAPPTRRPRLMRAAQVTATPGEDFIPAQGVLVWQSGDGAPKQVQVSGWARGRARGWAREGGGEESLRLRRGAAAAAVATAAGAALFACCAGDGAGGEGARKRGAAGGGAAGAARQSEHVPPRQARHRRDCDSGCARLAWRATTLAAVATPAALTRCCAAQPTTAREWRGRAWR